MPYIVIIKADDQYFVMGDSLGNFIAFQTETQALDYYENGGGVNTGADAECRQMSERHCNSLLPSIVLVEEFSEVLEKILPARVSLHRLVNSFHVVVGITTRAGVSEYWNNGRRKALVWLRKGQGSAQTKLTGKEAEIEQMLSEGYPDTAIAEAFGVHYQTVIGFVNQMGFERGNVRRGKGRKKH